MIGNNILLAYEDDIVVLGESKTDLIKSTLKLLQKRENMKLK